jgi:hypothetical protein
MAPEVKAEFMFIEVWGHPYTSTVISCFSYI